ncbi:hypothetical protein EON83_02830 [bacterium]|nr:MAG: hypothetical protein EON83_02830 [bacterium]
MCQNKLSNFGPNSLRDLYPRAQILPDLFVMFSHKQDGVDEQTRHMDSPNYSIAALWQVIQECPRPEDVANMVLRLLESQLSISQKAQIALAARGALIRGGNFGFSSMSQRKLSTSLEISS